MDAFAPIKRPSLTIPLPTDAMMMHHHSSGHAIEPGKKPKSSSSRKPKQWRSGFVNPLDASGKKRKGRPPRAAYHAAGMLDSYDHRNVQVTELAKTARVFVDPRAHQRTASGASARLADSPDSKRQLAQEKRRAHREGTVVSSSSMSVDAASPPDSFASLSSWGSPQSQIRAASEVILVGGGQIGLEENEQQRSASVPAAGRQEQEGAGVPAIALPKLHPDLFNAYRFPPRPRLPSRPSIQAPRPQPLPLAPAFSLDSSSPEPTDPFASLLGGEPTAVPAFDGTFSLDGFDAVYESSQQPAAPAPLGTLLTPSVSRFMHDLDLLPTTSAFDQAGLSSFTFPPEPEAAPQSESFMSLNGGDWDGLMGSLSWSSNGEAL